MKLTKRKQFKFYRSYFDVYNALPENKRLEFIDALLNKQFLGIDPENLSSMVNLAWTGLYHSIDTQVKGYEAKTGDILRPETEDDTPPEIPPTQGGTQGGTQGAAEQRKKNEQAFLDRFNEVTKREGNRRFRVLDEKTKKQIRARLKEGYTIDDILTAAKHCFYNKYHQENPHHLTPEFITRPDKLQKYLVNDEKPSEIEKYTYDDITRMKDDDPNVFNKFRPCDFGGDKPVWVSVKDIQRHNLKLWQK